MEPATVVGLVTALVETFSDGHDDYSSWKRKRASGNHYHGRGSALPPCALATLLSISGSQIKETYDQAVAILGNDFATGDARCRSNLWAQLNILSDRVANLHRAAAASFSVVLDLADAVQVCEGVRRASLHALAEQYQRLAAGRPIPKALAIPKPKSMRNRTVRRTEPSLIEEDDRMTTAMTTTSDQLRFQSEPPSPPLTPKIEITSNASESSTRPTNSVFALFCAEALSLQVNPKQSIPGTPACSCGYVWDTDRDEARKTSTLLKEGFRMRARFLAKSHHGEHAFGCVLCTSSGKSDMYDSVERLRDHINASHSKWQLLHDADCCST